MSQIEIEDLLHAAMGLDTASIGSAAIERAVHARMAQNGARGLADYQQRLRSSPDELQELVEAVVVPETWFFRHHEAFRALNRFVIEEWLPAYPNGVLRVLSVPCSTGEEPFSIAMALLDGGLARDRFAIEAWDISRRALAGAERAIYGKNSFRGDDLSFRERHFESVSEGFKVTEAVRRAVCFRQGNLLAPDHPNTVGRFDVVFCRNVLIYFDRPTQERAMATLKQLLALAGTAFVGPAEALLMRGGGFVPTRDAMSFAFKKGSSARPARPALPPPAPMKALPKPASKLVAPLVSRAPLAARAPAVAAPQTVADLETARRLADAGRMNEAAGVCGAYLQEKGESADGHTLLGVIRDALGDGPSAVKSYRKALYLDPNHTEALMHLALLAERRGDAGEARRLHERARRVASK